MKAYISVINISLIMGSIFKAWWPIYSDKACSIPVFFPHCESVCSIFGIKSAPISSHTVPPCPDHNDDNGIDCKRDTRILHAIPGISHAPRITATSASVRCKQRYGMRRPWADAGLRRHTFVAGRCLAEYWTGEVRRYEKCWLIFLRSEVWTRIGIPLQGESRSP